MGQVLTRQQVIVMGAGAALLAVTLGVRQGFGFYLVPMTVELGWSRELFGLAMAIQIFSGVRPSPSSAGWRIDTGRAASLSAARFATPWV